MSSNVIPMPNRIPQWTFAERVRKARRDLGLGQKDFADRLGIRLSTYSAWETGRNTPDLAEVAPALESVTGVPRTWFLGWFNDESPRPEGPGGGTEDPSTGGTPLYHLPRVVHVDFAASKKVAA